MRLERQKTLLGERLIDDGLINHDQLRIALTDQQRSGEQLGRILVNLGFVEESALRDILGQALGQNSIDLVNSVPDHEALRRVPQTIARRNNIVPVAWHAARRTLTLAMTDPDDVRALDRLRSHLDGHIRLLPLLAGNADIQHAIDRFYGYELGIDSILHELETGELDVAVLAQQGQTYSQPLVRLIDAILSDAVKLEASDIHFEPEDGFLRIRYRVDGVLRQIRSLHNNYWSAIAVRLKVMAGMNIAETRAPQDGRVSLSISGQAIDFRVSTMATHYGENIVLRVLNRSRGLMRVGELGLPENTLATLQLMMSRPEGLMIVTGPTGSGKTTTLYSMLSHLNTEHVNIMALEDPIEYPMPMIRQSAINESVNFGFADGIRTMLRQDPDIILVGEIRDADTAEMAIRAAMTGHQVYSTLHTNSAVGAIARLLDIGVLPSVLAGNMIGIVAQRLVRRLCPHCKQPSPPTAVECRILDLDDNRDVALHRPIGCSHCGGQGYRGRLALMEVLRITPTIDSLIATEAPAAAIQRAALESGCVPLSEDGLRRVRDGSTSLAEVSRVVDLTNHFCT